MDIFDNLDGTLGGLLEKTRRKATNTERLFNKLTGRSKFDANTLVYPSGQGESKTLQGHYIKFQIWETEGLSESNSRGKSRRVSNFNEIPGQPAKRNATRITRKTSGIENIPMVERENIVLYMPESLKTTYSAEWDLGEIGIATGKVLSGVKSIQDANGILEQTKQSFKVGSEAVSSILNREALANLGISVSQALAQTSNIRNTISAGTRITRSPHLDFIFKSIGTRQFNFEFRFNPYDDQESQAMFDIIKTFKMHMHPKLKTLDGLDKTETSTLGVFYQYPSVFKISFHSHGKENEWLHKMAVSALVNMDVDYTASGTTSFLRDKEGAGSPPADVNVTLSFVELDILSRDNIEEGF